jgi:GTPase
MSKFKSGFVSLVGRPNAGKSTLLNALVGQKVAIVADKPQTTARRSRACSRCRRADRFLDTPGIHKADSQLNKRLMDTVRASLEERDLLLFLVDARAPSRQGRPRHRSGAQEPARPWCWCSTRSTC